MYHRCYILSRLQSEKQQWNVTKRISSNPMEIQPEDVLDYKTYGDDVKGQQTNSCVFAQHPGDT